MKAKIFLLVIFIGAILSSCNDVDEVPPRASTITEKRFELPMGTPLTQEERSILNAMRSEYENAIK